MYTNRKTLAITTLENRVTRKKVQWFWDGGCQCYGDCDCYKTRGWTEPFYLYDGKYHTEKEALDVRENILRTRASTDADYALACEWLNEKGKAYVNKKITYLKKEWCKQKSHTEILESKVLFAQAYSLLRSKNEL